jgi:hypothetical protein
MKLRRITWKTADLSRKLACAQWLADQGMTATAIEHEQEAGQWVTVWTMK